MSSQELGGRITFLEWIRGAAAALVALEHVLEYTAPNLLSHVSDVANPGRAGVVAFFLVSGYVIPLSFERQDVRTFLIRRTFRLYPVYWLCLTVAVIALASVGEYSDFNPVVVGLAFLVNLTMLQGLVLLPSLLEPAWTLTIEWVFYFQQIIFKRRSSLDSAWVLGYGWAAAFLLVCGVEQITGIDLPATFALLLAVSCLGHAWARYDRGRMSGRSVLGMGAVVCGVVPLGMLVGIDDWSVERYTLSTYAGIALFAVFWAVRERFESRALVWLGSISYALYLSHGLLLYPLTHAGDLPGSVVLVASVIGMPLLAYALHVWLERPFIERGRRLSKRHLEQPTAPAASAS